MGMVPLPYFYRYDQLLSPTFQVVHMFILFPGYLAHDLLVVSVFFYLVHLCFGVFREMLWRMISEADRLAKFLNLYLKGHPYIWLHPRPWLEPRGGDDFEARPPLLSPQGSIFPVPLVIDEYMLTPNLHLWCLRKRDRVWDLHWKIGTGVVGD